MSILARTTCSLPSVSCAFRPAVVPQATFAHHTVRAPTTAVSGFQPRPSASFSHINLVAVRSMSTGVLPQSVRLAATSSTAPARNNSHTQALLRLHRVLPSFYRQASPPNSASFSSSSSSSAIYTASPDLAMTTQVAPLSTSSVERKEVDASRLKPWSGYFKKSIDERVALLKESKPSLDVSLLKNGGLKPEVADVMVENCLGQLSLPIGLAPTVVVNGKHFLVPMCVEEPSVIAAASGVAKLVAKAGGFVCNSTDNIMTGQIQIMDVADPQDVVNMLNSPDQKVQLIEAANTHCSRMKKRGGGVVDLSARVVTPRSRHRKVSNTPYVIVHIQINVCDAMGANLINTVAEGLATRLEQVTKGRAALKILTNLCVERRTVSTFSIPIKLLSWKGVDGRVVAERIMEAYYLAEDDTFRATTNNKGVMNGIDAVAIATGQDWRAIEAAAHVSAMRRSDTGEVYYGPMATYALEDHPTHGQVLTGRLEMPISVGTIGGALQTHPLYKLTHKMLGNPDSKTLAQIILSVGLAQNFAAIRALAIEGIQRGHMALHARNVAVAAGVPPELVSEVTSHMVDLNKIHVNTAMEYMKARALKTNATSSSDAKQQAQSH